MKLKQRRMVTKPVYRQTTTIEMDMEIIAFLSTQFYSIQVKSIP